MKITKFDINNVYWKYRHKNLINYLDKPMMPIMVCILEDFYFALANLFDHTISNFNTCISLHSSAFITIEDLDIITAPSLFKESTLWSSRMSNWLGSFAKRYALEPQFDYMYFFNFYGDATLYLNLSDEQLSALGAFFKEEHDALKFTHRWSYEHFNCNFLEHMVNLLEKEDPVLELDSLLANYAIRTKEEKQHKRQCTFSLLPLSADVMHNFLRENSFTKPLIRVSFEYKINVNMGNNILTYTSWADLASQSFRLFLVMLDLSVNMNVFTVVWQASDSVFVDFYFENVFEEKLSKELLHNFSNANYGVQLEPNGLITPELLEEVICHGITDVSDSNFFDLLPKESIAFYSLYSVGDYQRLSLRHYSYLHNIVPRKKPAFSSFTILMFSLFDIFEEKNLEDDPAVWFKPLPVK